VNPPHLRGSIYPGDRELATNGMVTVQVRRLNLTNEDDVVVANDVPFLAVKLPATGVRPIITQDQAAQPVTGGGAP
jgi:hypothetical protein